MIDSKEFFNHVRSKFGRLKQGQVDGFNQILSKWDESKEKDLRWLAYIFATSWHETGFTMQPITEYGSLKYLKSKKYYPYVGRGYVQLTWKENYKKYGIENTPEKALEPDMASHILIDGMVNGVFTGKRLSQYFNEKKNDPIGARRVINGTDKAGQISVYHAHFLSAIFASHLKLNVAKLV